MSMIDHLGDEVAALQFRISLLVSALVSFSRLTKIHTREGAEALVRRVDPAVPVEGWDHPEEVLLRAVMVLAERKRQISSSPLGREETGASHSTTLGASSPVEDESAARAAAAKIRDF